MARYFCGPAASFTGPTLQALLALVPALPGGRAPDATAPGRGGIPWPEGVRWRKDGARWCFSVPAATYPAWAEAAMNRLELPAAAALAMLATPEWAPVEPEEFT